MGEGLIKEAVGTVLKEKRVELVQLPFTSAEDYEDAAQALCWACEKPCEPWRLGGTDGVLSKPCERLEELADRFAEAKFLIERAKAEVLVGKVEDGLAKVGRWRFEADAEDGDWLFRIYRFEKPLSVKQSSSLYLRFWHDFERKRAFLTKRSLIGLEAKLSEISEKNVHLHFEPELTYADGKGAIVYDTPAGFFAFDAEVSADLAPTGSLRLTFASRERSGVGRICQSVFIDPDEFDFVPDEFRLLREDAVRRKQKFRRFFDKVARKVSDELWSVLLLKLAEEAEKRLVQDERFKNLPEEERLKLLGRLRADRGFLEKALKASTPRVIGLGPFGEIAISPAEPRKRKKRRAMPRE